MLEVRTQIGTHAMYYAASSLGSAARMGLSLKWTVFKFYPLTFENDLSFSMLSKKTRSDLLMSIPLSTPQFCRMLTISTLITSRHFVHMLETDWFYFEAYVLCICTCKKNNLKNCAKKLTKLKKKFEYPTSVYIVATSIYKNTLVRVILYSFFLSCIFCIRAIVKPNY